MTLDSRIRGYNRIFCIGLNKTGTVSLHQAFLFLGLRSIHHGLPNLKTVSEHLESARRIAREIRHAVEIGAPILAVCEGYDAYSDITPITEHFDLVDEQYPGSKFIYTDRADEDWIQSRTRHVLRNQAQVALGSYETTFLKVEPEKWLSEKKAHFAKVCQYFSDRPNDILFMNICMGDGYEKLCPFLGLPVPPTTFPHLNKSR